MAKKTKAKSMAELTAGYEKFIKGKRANPDGKAAFDATIKKAVTPKRQRASK